MNMTRVMRGVIIPFVLLFCFEVFQHLTLWAITLPSAFRKWSRRSSGCCINPSNKFLLGTVSFYFPVQKYSHIATLRQLNKMCSWQSFHTSLHHSLAKWYYFFLILNCFWLGHHSKSVTGMLSISKTALRFSCASKPCLEQFEKLAEGYRKPHPLGSFWPHPPWTPMASKWCRTLGRFPSTEVGRNNHTYNFRKTHRTG